MERTWRLRERGFEKGKGMSQEIFRKLRKMLMEKLDVYRELTDQEILETIDELIVHGQVNGGVLQSLGYASMEKLENRNGFFKQKRMSDYVIPTSMDFPKQFYHLQENPYPWGPKGAKGMGELVFNGASAAYVDAVERALGITVTSIPIPPEDIEEALKKNAQ